MYVSLEAGVPQEEPAVVEEEAIEEPPAPETIIEEEPEPAIEEVTAPAPKRRGRPKKDPTVKAAPKKAVKMKLPQPVTPESSDDDEPLNRNDMETLLLDFLIQRKQSLQKMPGATCGPSLQDYGKSSSYVNGENKGTKE